MKRYAAFALLAVLAWPLQAGAAETGQWKIKENVNRMDGKTTHLLYVDSNEPDRVRVMPTYARLVVRLTDTKRGHAVEIYVVVHGVVAPVRFGYRDLGTTPVRYRFDDGKPKNQDWARSEDDTAIFAPLGRRFLDGLTQHKTFIFEFRYYQEGPTVVTFDIAGLEAQLRLAGETMQAETR